MRTILANATIHDPVHGRSGESADIHIVDGRIVAPARADAQDRRVDCSGLVLMAGAIDLHTHIGGGKVNIARMLMSEDHERHQSLPTDLLRGGVGGAAPSCAITGYRYAQMGYTACFEPAMLPANARQAHLEMGDIPMVDHGAYAMLGSDDFLLTLLAQGREQAVINDYVAWTLRATQAVGLKVVNPGGISAFKFNQRSLDVDDLHVHYRVSPRQVVRCLARALHDLAVPHPLHVHASNLGVPGNVQSTLATIDAAEGLPIHLTHVQFHSYGRDGPKKFSSEAQRIADAVNAHDNVSIDIGQIMFGRTVTASGDTQAQTRGISLADPRRAVLMDIECDAGCGVVPFRYRDTSYVNALQWTIGLELFLAVHDPWRIFLTTDHPNGAPFTSYPRLIRLLMDRDFRNRQFDALPEEVRAISPLRDNPREYSLDEIAIMTRAAPARILGMADRGHLGDGAAADIVAYRPDADREKMFATPVFVYKDGERVVQDGQIIKTVIGNLHRVRPEHDAGIVTELNDWFERTQTMSTINFVIGDDEVCQCGHGMKLFTHPCQRGVFRR